MASPLTADIKVVLYRLFQEALNNALKHARATEVHVRLERGSPVCAWRCATTAAAWIPPKPADGMGLHNLDQRAKHIGYTARLTSAPRRRHHRHHPTRMSSTAPIPVALVDDHTLVRKGLVELIQQSGEYEVVLEASNGARVHRGPCPTPTCAWPSWT